MGTLSMPTTTETADADLPTWLDRSEYPFAPHWFETSHGRIHYVEAGPENASPVVFVHGTPTWSFEWRHLIKGLSHPRDAGTRYRYLAPDHLGFGLSDKPTDWTFRPEDHAANFAAWVEHLGLKNITLVVHDFGGPIGMSYALTHPENVRAIVLMNTWMWSLADDSHFTMAERLFGGAIGRFLYEQMAFSPRHILPTVYGDRKRLTRAIHDHYLNALPDANARKGTYGMLKGLIGSSAWYASLWERRMRLQNKPALIIWGGADSAFRKTELERWQVALPQAGVHVLDDVGHWPQEEAPERVLPLLSQML
jgi:pimeloyl-ACP methyl ester carboxylesterase